MLQLCLVPFSSALAQGNDYTTLEDTAEAALTQAARRAGVHSADGSRDQTATRLAREYAKRLSAQGYLDGHAGFPQRAAQLGGRATEVIALNYAGSLQDAANLCIRAWLGSRAHAAIMVPYHRRYGYALERSPHGAFCVGLFAD
jgi:hypothetical protein